MRNWAFTHSREYSQYIIQRPVKFIFVIITTIRSFIKKETILILGMLQNSYRTLMIILYNFVINYTMHINWSSSSFFLKTLG